MAGPRPAMTVGSMSHYRRGAWTPAFAGMTTGGRRYRTPRMEPPAINPRLGSLPGHR